MASTKLSRARPSPSKSPWRKERKAIDTDDEARYVVTVRSAKVRKEIRVVEYSAWFIHQSLAVTRPNERVSS